MKVLAIMIAAIIYFAVIICVWKIAYKDGKQHGESVEKIASKAREAVAYERGKNIGISLGRCEMYFPERKAVKQLKATLEVPRYENPTPEDMQRNEDAVKSLLLRDIKPYIHVKSEYSVGFSKFTATIEVVTDEP